MLILKHQFVTGHKTYLEVWNKKKVLRVDETPFCIQLERQRSPSVFSYRSNKGSFLFESLLCAKCLAKGFHFFLFNPPNCFEVD